MLWRLFGSVTDEARCFRFFGLGEFEVALRAKSARSENVGVGDREVSRDGALSGDERTELSESSLPSASLPLPSSIISTSWSCTSPLDVAFPMLISVLSIGELAESASSSSSSPGTGKLPILLFAGFSGLTTAFCFSASFFLTGLSISVSASEFASSSPPFVA